MNRHYFRPRGRSLAVGLLLAGRLAWGQAAGQGRVIDRIVAVVEGVDDGRVITWSDLTFEAAIALVQRGAMQAATVPLDDQALRTALDFAIAQRLLIAEADKVGAFQPDEAELDAAVRAFEAKFDSAAAFQRFLRKFDADQGALREVLRRTLRAERVLDSRVRLRAQVTEADVRRYYDEHQRELNGTYDVVRQSLRDKLLRDKYAALVAAEVQRLKKAGDVRMVAPPTAPGEESSP
ncbi:MAG TPA: hypothetical protein VFA20_24510 [Myxococcaceae bacterium]|nr:hypothetical protein [Myxococcaceae bacterium]